VGLSKDGKQLVLVSNAGEEFAVPVDHRLRTALRGDHARLGQLEMKMESALRPRDIQARIRGGESAEEVAAAAQTTVEAIMGFAAPVLAERAHVAESAQKSSIRRRSTETSTAAGTLDQAARTHLSNIGVRADDVDWDAWRRDDGRWAVVATYSSAGEELRAEFVYDQPGRYVVADNEQARLLTGEATQALAGAPSRRLSSVPDGRARFDDELPLADHELADHELGDDAIELVRDRPDGVGGDHRDNELTADHGDADWIARGEQVREDDQVDGAAPVEEPVADADVDDPQPAPSKSHKKGRSSVPSWDEIMFGGGKGE
jgi:Protein of unknown function (DUF3071)